MTSKRGRSGPLILAARVVDGRDAGSGGDHRQPVTEAGPGALLLGLSPLHVHWGRVLQLHILLVIQKSLLSCNFFFLLLGFVILAWFKIPMSQNFIFLWTHVSKSHLYRCTIHYGCMHQYFAYIWVFITVRRVENVTMVYFSAQIQEHPCYENSIFWRNNVSVKSFSSLKCN